MSLVTQLLYSLGAAANYIKLRAITGFLLIFYNQVVGLSPATVALVITITLVFDAVFDPFVGQISDNFRHRWGRRHPFMYFSAAPYALAFFLIWNPPIGWSEAAIFAYLLVTLLAIRLFDTFFETPLAALLPELTDDYHQRTVLFTFRSLFAAAGGLIMTVMAYQVFMKENPDGTGGILAREGYLPFSITFSLAIFAVIMISSLGTHSRIKYLHRLPARKVTLGAMAREMGAALNNHAFITIAVSQMLIAIAFGVHGGLEIYFSLYFWELTQAQLALKASLILVGAFVGVPFAPLLVRKLGKKRAWQSLAVLALASVATPITLRLLGLMPPNGTDLLFYILAGAAFFNAVTALTASVIGSSMMADVVEEVEVRTGRRSEGLLLAADNFFKKLVSSSGVLIAGAILTLLAFPKGAERGEVDPQTLFNMGLLYVPIFLSLLIGAVSVMWRFRIDEARHKDNLRRLRQVAQPGE